MKLSKGFTKWFVLITLLLVTPGLILSAADKAAKKNQWPVLKKGATVVKAKGVLRNMRSVTSIPLSKRTTPRKARPVLNLKRGLPLVKKATQQDTAVQGLDRSSKEGTLEPPRQPLYPIIDFAGLDFQNWGAGWPPDPTGDVGTTYYIQAVNTSIGIYRKSDGVPVLTTTFDDFFGGPGITGTPCDNDNNGDPIVLYDSYANRWIILDFAWYSNFSTGSWFSIAVSQTSDPLGNWYLYAMPAHPSWINDYPKLGVWHDSIFITANMFGHSSPYPFYGVQIWALNKADLYSGTLNSQSVFDNGNLSWSILPANAKGPTAPPANTPNYMITMDADEYGPPYTDKLVMWEYDVDWGNPGNTTWSGPVFLPTAPFGLTASNVPQAGTANTLDSLYGRLMFPANYREFDGFASMYVNHVCELGGRRTERWYEVRLNGGTPSIFQQGTYAPDSHHRWMGSIGADEDGNIALGYSVSSTTLHPAIRYGAQASIDSNPGVLTLGEDTIIDGTGSQTYTDRWGDYTHMTIDPVDDQTFWYTNEYYISNGSNWQTRIGAFKLKPDLWSQDKPDDTGVEPNTISNPMWVSSDIWVRRQPDGFTNQTHQNPEYGQINYLYVMIRCREGEGHGLDKVYWAFPGTGLSWPTSWNLIGQQPTGTVQQGNTNILEFPWNPPDPGAYGSPHFCLLSRIETAPSPPYGMTFPEVSSINTNVRNNNNIVWKNITIVDNDPNGGGGSSIISVGNLTDAQVTIRLEFRAPAVAPAGQLAAETTETDILDWGTVQVDLGKELFARWQTDGKNAGTGVTVDKDADNTVTIASEQANIEGIKLDPWEEQLIRVTFTPFDSSLTDKKSYNFDVVQFNFDGRKWVEIGGVRFVVKPPINAVEDSASQQ
jgi:hypothetical protein